MTHTTHEEKNKNDCDRKTLSSTNPLFCSAMKMHRKMEIGVKRRLGQKNEDIHLKTNHCTHNTKNGTVQLRFVTRFNYPMPHHLTLNDICEKLTGCTTLIKINKFRY